MKSRDFQLATSDTGLLGQKPAALEPIKLEELAEVLGGKNVQPTKGTFFAENLCSIIPL